MTLENLIKIEDHAREVWVVSPDLYFDIENQEFSEIVSVNLEQKTKYKYIVPATDDVLHRIELYRIKYKLTEHEVQANFLLLPVSELNPFILETGIYNGSSQECRAYAAPVSSGITDVIAFSEEASLRMAGHFAHLWRKYKQTEI
jgi:hypothetical protein